MILKTIIKKEIMDNLQSIRFFVLVFICMTLIPMSFFVSYRKYENNISDYNRSVKLNQEHLSNVKFSEIFTGDFSIKGYRPPSPLSVFAIGLSNDMPYALTAKKTGLTLVTKNTTTDSILESSGKIDFLLILLIVFSLLSILFTFDAICGEKESGTLKAALSNSIPRDLYVLGKYLGTMITLLIPFSISIIGGLILLIIPGYPITGHEMASRIVFIMLFSFFYISIFCCLGLFISSRVDNSKTSIIILISLWVVLCFVIPKGSHIMAEAILPVESDEVVKLEKSLLRQNLELEKGKLIDNALKKLPQQSSKYPDSHEYNRIMQELNDVLNPIRNEYAQKTNDGINKIHERVSLKKYRQNLFATSLSRISPAATTSRIITNLTWTGEQTRQNFITAAQMYQAVLNQEFFNYIYRDLSPTGSINMGITRNINLKELPVFQYHNVSLRETLASTYIDLAFTLFFLIFFFTLVYVSFLKYDIR